MDEKNPLVQILKQINELSGAALDALMKGSPAKGGGGEPEGAPREGGAPEGDKGAVPAPPGAAR